MKSPVARCKPLIRACERLLRPAYRLNKNGSCRVASYTAEIDPVVTTAWLQDHLEEVTVLDVRGHVDTVLVGEGVEQSTYVADYDQYLEGHVPVRTSQLLQRWTGE